jgi:hypothetical protein
MASRPFDVLCEGYTGMHLSVNPANGGSLSNVAR